MYSKGRTKNSITQGKPNSLAVKKFRNEEKTTKPIEKSNILFFIIILFNRTSS